jgi:hypothetical protein
MKLFPSTWNIFYVEYLTMRAWRIGSKREIFCPNKDWEIFFKSWKKILLKRMRLQERERERERNFYFLSFFTFLFSFLFLLHPLCHDIQSNDIEQNDTQHNEKKTWHSALKSTIQSCVVLSFIELWSAFCILCWVSLYWVTFFWMSFYLMSWHLTETRDNKTHFHCVRQCNKLECLYMPTIYNLV